jgi:hypothetical protein
MLGCLPTERGEVIEYGFFKDGFVKRNLMLQKMLA